MKFSNPNQFERVRRLEGLRNPADIWDITTFDEIKKQLNIVHLTLKN
jgi:hypothetical protein